MLNPILNPFSGKSNPTLLFHNSTRLNPKIGSGLATLFFLSFVSEMGKLMRDKKIRWANWPMGSNGPATTLASEYQLYVRF